MPTGYTPIYKITRNNIDITGHFSDRCVSIRVDFSAGDGQEDSCSLTLDDRDWAIARPVPGETISIFMGYREVGLAFMGAYELEEVHFTYPPKAIMLKGTASGAESFFSNLRSFRILRITRSVKSSTTWPKRVVSRLKSIHRYAILKSKNLMLMDPRMI